MTLDEADAILGYAVDVADAYLIHVVHSTYGLDGDHLRLQWPSMWPRRNPQLVRLDGDFTADELEAIAVHMRAHGASNV